MGITAFVFDLCVPPLNYKYLESLINIVLHISLSPLKIIAVLFHAVSPVVLIRLI